VSDESATTTMITLEPDDNDDDRGMRDVVSSTWKRGNEGEEGAKHQEVSGGQ
jgi:hypothetical protein